MDEADLDNTSLIREISDDYCRGNKKPIKSQWFKYIFVVALLLMWAASGYAAFPQVLVVNWTAYQGTVVSSTNGVYAKYVTNDGVVLLTGSCGGPVYFGVDEASALAIPWITGIWDGGASVALDGYSITIPQILVISPDQETYNIQGYDKAFDQSCSYFVAGTGMNSSGAFVAAYGGDGSIPDGYIFNFGDGTPIYRYQADSGPLIINRTENAWTPSPVSIFPSQLNFDGEIMTVTSFTEGFVTNYYDVDGWWGWYSPGWYPNAGYWSNVTYQGQNGSAELHEYIAGDGSTGIMWGNGTAGNFSVNAQWNPSTRSFVAGSVLDASLYTSSGSPTYGFPQYEWDGIMLTFKYHDVHGFDVYSNVLGNRYVIVNNSSLITVVGNSVTSIGETPGAGEACNQLLTNFAGVSADGMSLLGLSEPWVIVTTSGWDPGYLALRSCWGDYDQTFHPWTWSLYRPDRTAVFVYKNIYSYRAIQWVTVDINGFGRFNGSPLYDFNHAEIDIDATNGWPASGLLTCPPVVFNNQGVYINGRYISFYSNTDYGDNRDWCYYDESGQSGLYIYYTPYGETVWGYIDGRSFSGEIIYDGTLLHTNDPTYDVYISSGNNPASTPQYGPSMISWRGTVQYSGTSGQGLDVYSGPNGVVTIDSNYHVIAGGVSGTYNPETYVFNFGGNLSTRNLAAQDSTGLLGTSAGLNLGISTSGASLSLQLGDASLLNSSNSTIYLYQQDGITMARCMDIPTDCLFVMSEWAGDNDCPIYRYKPEISDTFYRDDESNLLYPSLYINGHYAYRDDTTVYGEPQAGGVSYHVQSPGGTVAIAYNWGTSGFAATVSGSYGAYSSFSGIWDGGKLFSNLPSGLVISLTPPPASVRYGPPKISCNGVVLTFDANASSVCGSNPQGADAYVDDSGTLRIFIAADGAVTLYKSDGTQVAGTYSSTNYSFSFSNQTLGTVIALNAQGEALLTVPTAPTGLTGTQQANVLHLQWSDNSDNETGFLIERSVNNGSNWMEVQIVNANATAVDVESSDLEKSYIYRVSAINSAGQSMPSNVVPCLIISPLQVNHILRAQQSGTQTLTLVNPTTDVIQYTIALTGNIVQDRGYWYMDSKYGSVPFTWEDISLTGTRLSVVSSADDDSEVINLGGFTFPFYGQSFSSVYVGSNGILTFGTGSGDGNNIWLASCYAPGNLIAPLWKDLNPSAGGGVYYKEKAGCLIVQYQDIPSSSGDEKYTFQVVLFNDGTIEFRYLDISGDSSNYTVGIQNSDGSEGLQISYYQCFLENSMAIRISSSALPFVEVTPLSGTLAPGAQSKIDIIFHGLNLPLGSYTANIQLTPVGSDSTLLNIPAVLEVANFPPTITITAPASGFTQVEGQNLKLIATATDPDNAIDHIEFYDGDTMIGGTYESKKNQYSITWDGLTTGTHAITAKAIDSLGADSSSQSISVIGIQDTDHDGIPDEWETANGLNPNDPSDSYEDSDGDGYPNIYKFAHEVSLHSGGIPIPDIIVDPNAGDNSPDGTFSTISAAVAALTHDYQIIQVLPGIYNESVNLETDNPYKVMLVSRDGPMMTAIIGQGGNSNRAISSYSNFVLRGFTVGHDASVYGGGISFGSHIMPTFALNAVASVTDVRFKYVVVSNCIIRDSIQDGEGGGMYCAGYTDDPWKIIVRNCVFINNYAGYNGGAIASYYNTKIDFCTFIDNSSDYGGKTFCVSDWKAWISNSIVWGDEDGQISGKAEVNHCDFQGGYAGEGNLDEYPLLAADGNLTDDSPCRSRGKKNSSIPFDITGKFRGDYPDMGAYQYSPSDAPIPDWWKLKYFGTVNVDPDAVANGDGLSNRNAYIYGFDPINPRNLDTDGDGIPDIWEIQHGLNRSVNDANEDPDHDGVPNIWEYRLNLDPHAADTGNTGIPDGMRILSGQYWTIQQLVKYGLYPDNLDYDGDGLTNAQEIAIGTDPFWADTDGDGIPDGQDVTPLDPTIPVLPPLDTIISVLPPLDPSDHTPPEIILTAPAGLPLLP